MDAIVLITPPNWSNGLSNFGNVVETLIESVFELRTMLGFAKLISENGLVGILLLPQYKCMEIFLIFEQPQLLHLLVNRSETCKDVSFVVFTYIV